MKKTYKDPVTYSYEGKIISKTEAISLMIKAGVDAHVRRCTMWELLQENATKGDQRAVKLLRSLKMTDNRD